MRKVTYFCDRCGKQLDTFYRINVVRLDQDGNLIDTTECAPELCPECFEKVDEAIALTISGKDLKPAAPKTKREPDEKKMGPKARDMGKVNALLDAGWSREKIGIEFGVSGQTISNWLKSEEEENDK